MLGDIISYSRCYKMGVRILWNPQKGPKFPSFLRGGETIKSFLRNHCVNFSKRVSVMWFWYFCRVRTMIAPDLFNKCNWNKSTTDDHTFFHCAFPSWYNLTQWREKPIAKLSKSHTVFRKVMKCNNWVFERATPFFLSDKPVVKWSVISLDTDTDMSAYSYHPIHIPCFSTKIMRSSILTLGRSMCGFLWTSIDSLLGIKIFYIHNVLRYC